MRQPVEYVTPDGGFPMSFGSISAGSFPLVSPLDCHPSRWFPACHPLPKVHHELSYHPVVQRYTQSNDVWISVLKMEVTYSMSIYTSFHVYLYLIPCLFIPKSVAVAALCVSYLYILSSSLYLSVVNSLELVNNSFRYTFPIQIIGVFSTLWVPELQNIFTVLTKLSKNKLKVNRIPKQSF